MLTEKIIKCRIETKAKIIYENGMFLKIILPDLSKAKFAHLEIPGGKRK